MKRSHAIGTLLAPSLLLLGAGCTDHERLGFVVVDAAVTVDVDAPDDLAEVSITAQIWGRGRTTFEVDEARAELVAPTDDGAVETLDPSDMVDKPSALLMSLDYAPDTPTLTDTYLEFEGSRVTLTNQSLENRHLSALCGEVVVLALLYPDRGEEIPLASTTEVTIRCQ